MNKRLKFSPLNRWLGRLLLVVTFCCCTSLSSYRCYAQQTNNPYSRAYQNRFGKLPSNPTRGDLMFADWIKLETEQIANRWANLSEQPAQWVKQQEQYRHQLKEMLGLEPLPERSELHATVTGVLAHPEFTVEKLHFQSRPGLYCTANLYLPKNASGPVPAILYLCGHGAVKQNGISYGNKVHYQHHGAWFARNGYACLVLDSVQLGEIEGVHHGTHKFGMWWWNSRGFSAAGPEAWNCIRALDYLQSRKEIDPERLGVTGRSGGGAYSWWIAALDERVKAACPVAGITDLQNHCIDGCVEGHCDCMFMVNTRRWDYAMVAALVAPRPLLICNTDKDGIFPLDGVVRLHAQVRSFYDALGAGDKLGIAITEGGHADTQELQLPVMRWFNRWLKKSDAPVMNHAERFFSPEELKVFESLPTDEITSRCYESFTTLASDNQPLVRESALAALKSQTFASWPEQASEAVPAIRTVSQQTVNNLRLTVLEIESQPKIDTRLYLLEPQNGAIEQLKVVILDQQGFAETLQSLCAKYELSDEQTYLESAARRDIAADHNATALLNQQESEVQSKGSGLGWLELISQPGSAVVWIAPRGVGLTALGGDSKYQTQIRRRLMLLGATLATGQVWDCIQATRAITKVDSLKLARIHVLAHPEMSEVACFTALFGRKFATVRLQIPPRDDQAAADFLNWSRIITPKQLKELVSDQAELVELSQSNSR